MLHLDGLHAILIHPVNRWTLMQKFNVKAEDANEMLPYGMFLIHDFANPTDYDLNSPEEFKKDYERLDVTLGFFWFSCKLKEKV